MPNADRTTIRNDLTFTGMATATTAVTVIRTRRLIGVVSFVDMTKVSGAMAATIVIVEATATTVAFHFPGNFRVQNN